MSALRIEQVSKRYQVGSRQIEALHDIRLEAGEGEFVVLLGPSGCGKTTLLQIVAGLEPPTGGAVWLDGRRVQGWGSERSLIFQRPSLFPWLTALDNVAFGLQMVGHPPNERRAAAREALQQMGLADAAELYPHQLSGGMQQRVALARALILDPAVLLMDEPLASVDALLRARLQRQVRAACRGKTVLFVTHSVREALVLADRLIILTPRPGHVRHEIAPPGEAPRDYSPSLARLEAEIENELLGGP